MRLRWLAAVGGVVMSVAVSAQQGPAAPPQITERLNNDQVRVIVATLQPQTPSRSTGDAISRVLIYLDAGVITREEAGSTTRLQFQRGDVRWVSSSEAYMLQNISDHSIRILEVQLKGPPAGQQRTTTLDPVALDGTHFRVLLENEYVRVLRVQYGPHESSPNHEHLWNRVILYLNDQVDVKADDVRLGPPRIHVEENASDQPLDAIAVELK